MGASEGAGLKPVIEALIFASDGAISLDRLARIIEGSEREAVRSALRELVDEYAGRGGGFLIEEVAGGYRFRTNPSLAPWIRRLWKSSAQKMSRASMETLAMVAYRQPVTRGELESLRGVDSGAVLATLMEKRFIKIVGRKEAPGRPVVYGTTKEFLEAFDLKDLSCLPSLRDIQNTEGEDADQAKGQAGEEAGEGPRGETPDQVEGGLARGEAPEDTGRLRDSVPPEGRGDDKGGPGDGEPDPGRDRDKGRPS
jgi:segregation and condensation protein B